MCRNDIFYKRPDGNALIKEEMSKTFVWLLWWLTKDQTHLDGCNYFNKHLIVVAFLLCVRVWTKTIYIYIYIYINI